MVSDGIIRVRYKYTPEDLGHFLLASRTPRGSAFFGVLGLVVAAFLAAGAIYAMSERRYRDGTTLLLLATPFLIRFLQSLGRIAPRKVGVPSEVSDEHSVEISPEVVHFD